MRILLTFLLCAIVAFGCKSQQSIFNTPGFPPTAGHAGKFLTNDGGKILSWATVTSGGGADGNNYLVSVSFNPATGDMTFVRNGLSSLTTNLDGRYYLNSNPAGYISSYTETQGLQQVTNINSITTNIIEAAGLTTSTGGDIFSGNDIIGSNLFGTGTRTLVASPSGVINAVTNGANGKVWKMVSGAPAWADETPGADGNNYPTSLAFSTSTGVITLGRNGLSDLTQSIDGRYYLNTNPLSYINLSQSRAGINLTTTGTGAATYNFLTGDLNIPTPSTPSTPTLHTVTSAGNTTTNDITVGNLSTTGDVFSGGAVTASGDLNASGDTYLTGQLNALGNVEVTGVSNLNNDVYISGALSTTSNIQTTGVVTAAGYRIDDGIGNMGTLGHVTLTDHRDWNFPDMDGTVALTSQLPTVNVTGAGNGLYLGSGLVKLGGTLSENTVIHNTANFRALKIRNGGIGSTTYITGYSGTDSSFLSVQGSSAHAATLNTTKTADGYYASVGTSYGDFGKARVIAHVSNTTLQVYIDSISLRQPDGNYKIYDTKTSSDFTTFKPAALNSTGDLVQMTDWPSAPVKAYGNWYETSSQDLSTASPIFMSTARMEQGILIDAMSTASELTIPSEGDYSISYSANAVCSSSTMSVKMQEWSGSAWVDVPGTKIAFSSNAGVVNSHNTLIYNLAAGAKIRFWGTATAGLPTCGLVSGNTDYSFQVSINKL